MIRDPDLVPGHALHAVGLLRPKPFSRQFGPGKNAVRVHAVPFIGFAARAENAALRVPLASVMANNRIYEIDYEGKVLREVPPLAPPNGPLITNLPGVGPLTPGQTLENSTLLRALELRK